MVISNPNLRGTTHRAKGADAEALGSVQAPIPVVPNKMGTTVVV